LPLPGAGNPAIAAAPASAAAAGVVGAQSQVDIPQSYVGLVLGKQASTINAIKNFSKANLVVEQHTPAEDRAQVIITGQQTDVDKAKHVIESLVDGSMNTQMLFQMLGTQAPLGGMKLDGGMAASLGTSPGAMPGAMAPGMPTGAGVNPLLAGLPGGLPGLGMPTQAPVMPTASLPISTSGGGVPQDPMQLHDSLNEYYARWWAQYGNMAQQNTDPSASTSEAASTNESKEPAGSAAFDKTALARLAELAAQNEELEKQREAVAQSVAETATSPASN